MTDRSILDNIVTLDPPAATPDDLVALLRQAAAGPAYHDLLRAAAERIATLEARGPRTVAYFAEPEGIWSPGIDLAAVEKTAVDAVQRMLDTGVLESSQRGRAEMRMVLVAAIESQWPGRFDVVIEPRRNDPRRSDLLLYPRIRRADEPMPPRTYVPGAPTVPRIEIKTGDL